MPDRDILGERPIAVTITGTEVYPSERPYESLVRESRRRVTTLGPIFDPPWNERPGAKWTEDASRYRRRIKRSQYNLG
jgi:hypothetical protein